MSQKNNNTNITSKIWSQKIINSRSFRFVKKVFCIKKDTVSEEKKIRQDLSEKKIDKMVKDSFPASDPPSTY